MSTASYKIISVMVEAREELLTCSSDKGIKGYQVILAGSEEERRFFSRSWLLTFRSPRQGPYEFFHFSFKEIQKVPGQSHRRKIHEGLSNTNNPLLILSSNWSNARRLFQKALRCFHPALVLSPRQYRWTPSNNRHRVDGPLRGAIPLCLRCALPEVKRVLVARYHPSYSRITLYSSYYPAPRSFFPCFT